MRLFFALFLGSALTINAQTPQVPHKMQFAGMTLTIRDDARREIQKDVNALTQSPRHHNMKVERAKTYFPIIEKVFEEERVPDDFKYLVIQESALIADAVSVSNAVGFWQFKDYTAVEMGLRVDKEIDERLNIVSSSRAAARYIKKNNFYFNNWIFALQAYQMGAGGAMKSLPGNLSGAKQMEITSSTYWYVKKYIAHKVAFEEAVKGEGQVRIIAYESEGKKMLRDIAKEVSINEEELKVYNKWAKTGRIPDDRTYTVIIPMTGDVKDLTMPEATTAKAEPVAEAKLASVQADRIKINGLRAVKGKAGETAAMLSKRAGVSTADFLKWNDISIHTSIVADQYYLLGKKRSRASEAYHKVSAGETLWQISQQYGVEMKKIRRYNRMKSQQEIKPGMTLWLASKRPKDFDEAIDSNEIIEVSNKETFAWTVDGDLPQTAASSGTLTDEPEKITTVSVTDIEDSVKNTSVSTKIAADSTQNLQPKNTVTSLSDSALKKTEIVVVTRTSKEHIVQAGETLYGIAHTYNVGVMDLVHWNNLNLQDGIRPGQILMISARQSVGSGLVGEKEIEHEVKTTDTLYSIARKYGVTIKELMEWNNKKDFSLAIGEKLKIQAK